MSIISLFLLICIVLPLSVSANSAQTEWSGVNASGTVITDEDSPIVVENEKLTLDLNEFPSNYYHEVSDYLTYSGKVTAEYHFYNPSDYTVTATLLFPFRQEPSYAADMYDENGVHLRDVDASKYTVTINGEPIETELRHSLFENYVVQELEGYTYLPVEDDFFSLPHYTPDLPVMAYTYTVSGLDDNMYPAATAALDVITPIDGTSLYVPDQRCLHINGSHRRLGVGVDNGKSFTVYLIGSHAATPPTWKLYQNGGVEDGTEIGGKVTLSEESEITLYDLAITYWTEESGIREVDWYNAFACQFMQPLANSNGLINNHYVTMNLDRNLYRWYKYEITLAPGERIINTVTAPIYPAISARYEPPVYAYTYLLSPAMTWKEFGTLDIYINTPFYLIENSLGEFEKNEQGYQLHLKSLPKGTELNFTLSESPMPERAKPNIRYATVMLLIIYGYLFAFAYSVIRIIGIIALIITLVKFRRKKEKQKQ